MATVYKPLSPEDIIVAKTILNEAIPITGSIVSGTYSSSVGETNIYNYAHGMFQTVYDYPYASSSANNLFDITIGISNGSPASSSANTTQLSKKLAIYNQMANILMGNDITGGILRFDRDGDPATSPKILNAFFLNFSRLLYKDQIKKGSFVLQLGPDFGVSGSSPIAGTMVISDTSSAFRTNSPAGEYGILRVDSITANSSSNASKASSDAGLIFYQAGVAVLNTDIFASYGTATNTLATASNGQLANSAAMSGSGVNYLNVHTLFVTGTIQQAADSLRKRIKRIDFQNTTQLNSTIHYIRINNNEFNYSSNPTYLSSSQIRVKGGNSQNAPISYITSIGLYSADNELLATAKLSQPLQKTETDSLTLRVRLDY